jgi:nucleotide-binding universal stress UspA family protein
MYKKIVILIDNSSIMEDVVKYVHTLFPDATLYLLSVINLGPFNGYYTKSVYREMHRLAEKTLNNLELILENEGAKFQTKIIEGEPIHKLLTYAKENNAELVVLETHSGQSVNKIKIGNTTYRLIINSHLPILLLNENLEIKKPLKVLHPTTGTIYSEIATNVTGMLASYWNAEVNAVILRDPKEKIAERIKEILKTYNIEPKITFPENDKLNFIINEAEAFDIVIASRGSPVPLYRLHRLFKPLSLNANLKTFIAFLPKPLLLTCD